MEDWELHRIWYNIWHLQTTTMDKSSVIPILGTESVRITLLYQNSWIHSLDSSVWAGMDKCPMALVAHKQIIYFYRSAFFPNTTVAVVFALYLYSAYVYLNNDCRI